MLKKRINELRQVKKTHPYFFLFAVIIFLLYGLQFIAKTEITPLGYFALYSDVSYPQKSYRQILPMCLKSRDGGSLKFKVDFDSIYEAKGAGFLMLEILPTRYDILSKSDHCNQMNHKLERLGFHDENNRDCESLEKFHKWFDTYRKKLGMNTNSACMLMDVGFKDGKVIDYKFLESAD